jgi:hypothetical protein
MIELPLDLLKKALQVMESNTYQNLCLLENSTTNPLAIYRYDVNEKSKYDFHREFNKKADYVVFPKGKYLKFSFPININTPEDKEERRKRKADKKPYVTLQDRGNLNRPTVEMYIDGIKIPDSEVLLTIFDGGLDLYVPEDYVEGDSCQINLLINKYTGTDRYFNKVESGLSLTKSLMYQNIHSRIELNEDAFKVFKNGLKLSRGLDYNLVVVDRNIFIDFNDFLEKTDTIEVIGSPYCVYTKEYENKEDPLIDFPWDVVENLPISVELLEVYRNGKRIFPQDLKIATARHFVMKEFQKDDKISVRVQYNPKAITDENEYIDDILRYFQFKNRDDIIDIIVNGDYDSQVPPVPDWIKDIVFPPDYIPIHDVNPGKDGLTYEEWLIETIKEYIKNSSQNMRYLMEQFAGLDDYIYAVDKDRMLRWDTSKELGEFNFIKFDKPKVVVSIKTKMKKFEPLVFVNDDKFYRHEVLHITHMGTTYIYVDADLVEDSDILRVRVLPVYNKPQKAYSLEINESNISEFYFRVDKAVFGEIRKPTDILVMKRKGNGFSYLKFGDSYFIEEDEDTNYIRIYIGARNIGDVFFIYNNLFSDYRYHTFNEDLEQRLKLPYDVLDSTGTYYIPRMSNYAHILFLNREMMIEGLDYYVVTQTAHDDIVYAKIMFKSIPEPNDQLEIYYYEQEKKQLAVIEEVDSEYGLIYLKNLPFPFSLEYMELYVSGIKLGAKDIEILGDSLIRIINPNIPRPYRDVVIYTNLQIPMDDIGDFTDVYEENPSKWDDYLEEEYIDGPHDLDDMFEDVNPDVPPLPIDPDVQPPKKRIDPFLNFIAISLLQGDIPRKLDGNVWLNFVNKIEFAEIMSPEDRAKSEIILDTNKNNILIDAIIDVDGTLKPIEEVLEILGNHLENEEFSRLIDPNNEFTDYDKEKMSQYLYAEEIKLATPNVPTTKQFIFDANSFSEDEEIISETVTLDLTEKKFVLVGDENDNSTFYQEYNLVAFPIAEVISVSVNGVLYTNQPEEVEFIKSTGKLKLRTVNIQPQDTVVLLYVKNEYVY